MLEWPGQPPGTRRARLPSVNSASPIGNHEYETLLPKLMFYRLSGHVLNYMARWLRVSVISLVALPAFTGCGQAPRPENSAPVIHEWHEFEGTWTAAGSRDIMRMGSDRQSSIANLAGSLLLAGPSRPAIGFRAEAIVLNDSATGMVGRAVWTDEHGDQAYSELRGEGTAAENKIVGTSLGGTGRYAGVTGSYEFSWRFVLENEDGTIQGQSVGLKGRIHIGSPPVTTHTGDPRS